MSSHLSHFTVNRLTCYTHRQSATPVICIQAAIVFIDAAVRECVLPTCLINRLAIAVYLLDVWPLLGSGMFFTCGPGVPADPFYFCLRKEVGGDCPYLCLRVLGPMHLMVPRGPM